jgi:uncharacterized membrane protein YdbT with pleckstrin-like domain
MAVLHTLTGINNFRKMYILGKKNKLGKKTFWYFFVTKNIIGILLMVLSFFVAYEIKYGKLSSLVQIFLNDNINYVTTSMVSLWVFLAAISIIVIILARTSVLYKQYSYVLHNHALHITHGIFFVKEKIIPYPQITNVEIIRPYIYSLFGLVRLSIETGQTENTNSKSHHKTKDLPPMDKRAATNLAHELMRRSALQSGYDFETKSENANLIQKKRRRR